MQFINAIASSKYKGSTTAISLRLDLYVTTLKSDLWKTDISAYHGGTIIDEIAALCSMILGVRIWAGSLSRIFGQDGDPLGRPVEFEYSLPRQVGDDPHGNLVLPEAIGRTNQTDLKSLRMLNSVTTLNCEVAVSLIRSARLYQAALWLSESAPELCWLLLVSSIEVAAGTWSTANDAPWKRLKHSKPELAEQLTRAGGHDHLVAVAEMIKDSLGATKKFELFC